MEVYDLTGERTLLNKEAAEKIAATIIENAATLKKVILKTKTYKADVARIIGEALAQAKGIEELDLSDTISGLSFDEAQQTCEVFVECFNGLHLKYLDLSDNALGPKGVKSCEGLISGKMDLEVLLFNNDGMSADACQNLYEIIKKHAPMNIKRIEFHNNMSGDAGATAVAGIIECLPQLEVFRWSATRTNEEGSTALCKALSNCPNMRELIIRDNYFGEDLGELAASMVASMKNLKKLIFSDLSLGDDGVLPVLRAVKEQGIQLEVLDISYNDITEETIQYLCEWLEGQTELKELVVGNNYLGSRLACMLMRAVEKNCPQMERIGLKSNEIGPKASELAVKICAKLEHFQLIDLDGNQISEEMVKEIQNFLEEEKKTSILGSLDKNDPEWTSEEFDEIKEFF